MGFGSRIRIVFLFLFLLTTTGFLNPTDIIEDKQEQFRAQYKDNHIFYNYNGQTMHFAWSGSAEKQPLILIHGSPGNYEGWSEFLMNENLQKRFHIIAVDRPGYGGSGKGKAERSLQKQSEAIWAALQYNKSGLKPIVVGHSYGGSVIGRMAIDHPGQIAGAIYVAASVDPTFEKTSWYQYVGDWPIVSWLLPSFLRVCNQEIMALNSELNQMQALWKNADAPTVIIQGDQDKLVVPENEKFLRIKIDPAFIVKSYMIEGLNHYVPWKRPDLILNAIELLEKK